jgi:hypothetical protein
MEFNKICDQGGCLCFVHLLEYLEQNVYNRQQNLSIAENYYLRVLFLSILI